MLVGKHRSIELPSSSGPFDFISDLPSNLIDEILMRLPLSDAARTSVLSTKWRYLWTKLPQLIFDATFCQNSRGGYKDKLLSSGFVLSLHQARVLRFVLSIPGLLSCPEIDKFIVFLSLNKVEDFTLHVSHGNNHKLPSHFFLCHQLKRICLRNCELRPPSSFQGFKKLVSLELYDVTFTGDSIVTFISSKCPRLKKLTFLSSTFAGRIEINAPNLLYLHIGCTLKLLSLKNVPKLLDLSMTSYAEQTVVSQAASYQNASHTQSFLSCLPSLEKLELCYVSLKCLASGNVLGRHPLCRLSCLKELNIWGLSFTAKDEILPALWLMRNSPNLTSIMLEFDHAFDDHPDVRHNYSGISFEYVHQVCLLGFTGVKPEIQFIQFILAAAPNLYNFSIKPFPFRENCKDIILKRIMEFKRASAVVNFRWKSELSNLALLFQRDMLPKTIRFRNHNNENDHRKVTNLMSNPPDDVICNILARLPLKQAARTSIISRKWRYKWARLPQLVFDYEFSLKCSDKLMALVCEIILLHQAPILKFNLSNVHLSSCREIDKVIQFLSRSSIEDLTLHVGVAANHKLPSHFFLCQHLKHLSLGNCEIRCPLSFRGFDQLVKLELLNVVFTGCTTQSFISRCPMLVELVFESWNAVGTLELYARHLRYLYITGNSVSIVFKNVPQLLELQIVSRKMVESGIAAEWKPSDVEEFIACLASVEFLALDCRVLKLLTAGIILLRAPTTLSRLQNLCLVHICFKEMYQISCVLWLIKSSPNLHRFTIEMDPAVADDDGPAFEFLKEQAAFEYLQEQDYSGVSLDHLHEVNMQYVTGHTPELEFIRILLDMSPSLKKFSVRSDEHISFEQEVELLSKILDFPRASAAAQIKYFKQG